MSDQPYVVGWTDRRDWDAWDGDFVMEFERCVYATSGLARNHAKAIAQTNPEYVFIVLDESDDCYDDPIIYVSPAAERPGA